MKRLIRTFKYQLKPNDQSFRWLNHTLNLCRSLYNAALEERRTHWKRKRISISCNDQQISLTQIRSEHPEFAELPRRIAVDCLVRLDRAFKGFFRRVKKNVEEPGYPRFKSANRYDSFSIAAPPGTGWSIDTDKSIIKIGKVSIKVNFHRPFHGQPIGFSIKRTGRKWFVAITSDIGEAPAKVPVAKHPVGMDFGLETLLTFDDGTIVGNPRWLRDSLARLKEAQHRLSLKTNKRSRRRAKAKAALNKLHERVANQRREFLHVVSKDIVERFDYICFEDLNIKGLMQLPSPTGKAKGIHRNIGDASWGMLTSMVIYKAEEAGKWTVPVNPRGTSQVCAKCGADVPKKLHEREHRCACGYVVHRDVNSANEVLNRGVRLAKIPIEWDRCRVGFHCR